MKKHFPKLLPGSIAAGLMLSVAPVQGAIWDGGGVDNEYSTPENWDDNLVPSGTQDINGVFTVTRSVDSTALRTFIKGGAVVNVTGGVHDDTQSGASIFNFLGDVGAGTVNQSGGTYKIGHGLRIGVGSSPDGTYNLTGGTLEIYRGSNSNMDGSNPGGRPSMEVGDSSGSGLFEISGGSLLTRAGVHVASNGIFRVVGSGATSIDIGPQGSGDGSWIQTGTLSAAIDLGGVTPIVVDDWDDVGGVTAEFRSGALLDLSFTGGVTPYGGTWTILEAENTTIVDLGLALSPATLADPNWSFAVDNTGVNGLVTATYAIPEPSAIAALFGLFGLGFISVRRRR